MGSVRTHQAVISRIARASQARALALDYRLAPENPFPAAVEDSVAAYRWMLGQGFRPEQIVVCGDSAGGGLALALLLALREQGISLPAAAVALSPWTDLAATGTSVAANDGRDPLVPAEDLPLMAAQYLAGEDPRTPLASPLYAEFKGLPPLLIQVGTAEVLLDDGVRVAERARAAGVVVELELWEEMIHGWQLFAVILPEAVQAIESVGRFVRVHAG
jgi:acetyl esterase/lipase